jgi:hypothetical protein
LIKARKALEGPDNISIYPNSKKESRRKKFPRFLPTVLQVNGGALLINGGEYSHIFEFEGAILTWWALLIIIMFMLIASLEAMRDFCSSILNLCRSADAMEQSLGKKF